MRLIASLKQRWADYRRETRIRLLAQSVAAEMVAGRWAMAREANNTLRGEIALRSRKQVTRMERRHGIRAR